MRKIVVVLFLLLYAPLLAAQSRSGDFRIVLAGDTNLHQRLSVYKDSEFLKFYERIRTADAAFLNIESQVQPNLYPGPGAAWSGGIYLYSPAWLLDEYKWAGFNLFSVANNHATDYGTDGLRASIKALHEAGLTYAGAGENLALARAPGYLDTEHGRVAVIAASSTLLPGSWASEQRPDLPGRFGVNPLRSKTTYTVKPETLQVLREAASIGRARPNTNPVLEFGNAFYQAGDTPGVRTEADPRDLEGLIASVRDANRQADWVLVTYHGHESSSTNPSGAADFLVDFSRAAIDNGADIVANHGPHDLRGIEIYKGKAIFYGLGNFAFDGHVTPVQPSELYERRGLPPTSTISDLWKTPGEPNPNGLWNEDTFETAVFDLIFSQEGKLKQIIATPISLLWAKGAHEGKTLSTRAGIPGPASPQVAVRVLERLARLSASLGTKIEIKDGRGYINLE